MRDIFEHIKDKEWDWFGMSKTEGSIENWNVWEDAIYLLYDNEVHYSLADLLANESWAIAVWGEPHGAEFFIHAKKGFEILFLEGEEECIKYIKETMI